MWFGGAHTKGEELTFVEPDRTLVSGDVVQSKVVPNIFGDGGTPSSWLAVLEKVAALHAMRVLPDHRPPGDGSMIELERKFIADLRDSALHLKSQGVSAYECDWVCTQYLRGITPIASHKARPRATGTRDRSFDLAPA